MAAPAWMPWVVLTVTSAWREGGRKILAATLFGTLQMLSGAPEFILATWLVTTILVLAERRRNGAEFRRQLARFAVVMVLVTAMSAAQLLPFLNLVAHSRRDQSFSSSSWPMPGWGLANLLVPQFFTYILYHGVRFQYGQGWTSSYYASRHTVLQPLMDFLSVSQVTKPDSFFDWSNRTSWLPMITSGQQPVFADAPTTLAALTNSSFDPRRVVYFLIEVEPHFQTGTLVPARIQTQHASAHRLDLGVETSGPTVVTVAQAYYSAWRARVDGRPAPVWRANHPFQAVEVPAGNHRVVLRYVDGPFYWGGFLLLAVLLGCAAASARSKKPPG